MGTGRHNMRPPPPPPSLAPPPPRCWKKGILLRCWKASGLLVCSALLQHLVRWSGMGERRRDKRLKSGLEMRSKSSKPTTRSSKKP